jgi:hypothetical protein
MKKIFKIAGRPKIREIVQAQSKSNSQKASKKYIFAFCGVFGKLHYKEANLK